MSLSIGLSGLRATNESLNVISHNIANVSTAGFKGLVPNLPPCTVAVKPVAWR